MACVVILSMAAMGPTCWAQDNTQEIDWLNRSHKIHDDRSSAVKLRDDALQDSRKAEKQGHVLQQFRALLIVVWADELQRVLAINPTDRETYINYALKLRKNGITFPKTEDETRELNHIVEIGKSLGAPRSKEVADAYRTLVLGTASKKLDLLEFRNFVKDLVNGSTSLPERYASLSVDYLTGDWTAAKTPVKPDPGSHVNTSDYPGPNEAVEALSAWVGVVNSSADERTKALSQLSGTVRSPGVYCSMANTDWFAMAKLDAELHYQAMSRLFAPQWNDHPSAKFAHIQEEAIFDHQAGNLTSAKNLIEELVGLSDSVDTNYGVSRDPTIDLITETYGGESATRQLAGLSLIRLLKSKRLNESTYDLDLNCSIRLARAGYPRSALYILQLGSHQDTLAQESINFLDATQWTTSAVRYSSRIAARKVIDETDSLLTSTQKAALLDSVLAMIGKLFSGPLPPDTVLGQIPQDAKKQIDDKFLSVKSFDQSNLTKFLMIAKNGRLDNAVAQTRVFEVLDSLESQLKRLNWPKREQFCSPPPKRVAHVTFDAGDEDVRIFVQTSEHPDGREAKSTIPRGELRSLARAIISACRDAGSDPLPSGRKLYDLLIAPVQRYLEEDNINRLVVSSNPDLASVPLAALWDGSKYLVEKFALSNTSVLSRRSEKVVWPKSPTIIEASTSSFTARGSVFPSLPEVSTECEAIEKATKGTIQRQWPKTPHGWVHYAGHFLFDPKSPDDSILGVGDNGWDTLGRIRGERGLDFKNIDGLFLNGCATGTASFGPVPIPTIADVALKSGASAVIATQWPVNDLMAQKFAVDFYQKASLGSANQDLDEVLAQTQRSMIMSPSPSSVTRRGTVSTAKSSAKWKSPDKKPCHPCHWAGYQLYQGL